MPIVFLAVLELTLRMIGIGYPTRFLLAARRDNSAVFVQNDRFGWRFFGRQKARIPEAFCIPKVKDPNTVRIIVFGGSAALGDPDPRFGLPRMLQAMLELRYPRTHFEVVNAAMVAINSNVVLPIARDCARAGANVWVIYMGNNEVVGPFGAGTVFGRQVPPLPLIRAALAVKTTRVGQLIDDIGSEIKKPPLDRQEWGGMEMFLDQQVRSGDPRMTAVYRHFSRNLSDIINDGTKSGAGIVVSTVPVNLRDCAPFASEHRRDLTAPKMREWERCYQNGVAAQSSGNPREASSWYDQAAKIDNQFAALRFREGCCALALDQTTGAQQQFIAARDLDTLRFRCDRTVNDLIRQAVSNCARSSVLLADAERVFADHSPNGLPGKKWFYDHVHLTFDGNYLLALTIGHKVTGLLPANVNAEVSANQPWPSESDCARRLAWSDWDRQKSLADMYSRFAGPPFASQLNHDAQVQTMKKSLEELAFATQPAGIHSARILCENAVAAAPGDPVLREQLAMLDELSGDLAGAETNASQSVRLLPGSSEDWSQLGVIQAKQKEYENAAMAFRRAFQLNPNDVWSLQNLAQSLKDLGKYSDATREYRHSLAVNPRFGLAWLGLGQVDEQTGHKAEAEDCYQKALRNRIDRPLELAALARFCVARGWREAAASNFLEAIKLNPTDFTLLLDAGRNFSALGRHAGAARCFSAAIQLAPDSIEARFRDGLELGQAGQPAEAAKQFRAVIRLMPNMPQAHLNLGLALFNLGNYSEALVQFKNVLELDPANAQARQYVQALQQELSRKIPN